MSLEGLGEAMQTAMVGFLTLLCLLPFTLIGMWTVAHWIFSHVQIGLK